MPLQERLDEKQKKLQELGQKIVELDTRINGMNQAKQQLIQEANRLEGAIGELMQMAEDLKKGKAS